MSSPLAIQIKAEVDKQDIHVCRFTVDRPVHEGTAVFTRQKKQRTTTWLTNCSRFQE